MDLKALLTRLEVLDKKQNLMESEDRKPAKEKERDVTLPSGAKVKSRTVQGWQSQKADKDADKESKKKDEGVIFRSGIANELLREFGLEEAAPIANPYTGADAEKFAALDPKDQAWLTKGGGKPDINDPYILARAPNKGKPAPKPAAAAPAAAPAAAGAAAGGAAPAAGAPAAAGSTTAGFDDGSKITTTPGGAAATDSEGNPYIPGSNPNLPKNQTKTQDMGDGSKLTTGPGGVAATNDDGTPYVPGSNPNLPQNQKPAAAPAAAPAASATAKPPADGAGGDAAVEATRKRMKELLDKLEKTGGVSGAPAAPAPAAAKPAAKPPVGGKPAAGGATMPGVDVMGNPTGMPMKSESVDDYILALIRSK